MPDAREPAERSLRDYFDVLANRKWTVAVVTAAAVVSALAASFLQVPVYEASAELLMQPRAAENLFDPALAQGGDRGRSIQTELQVLRSRPVRAKVLEELGTAPAVQAAPIGNTDVISVVHRSTDPERAATVANTWARAYVEFRREKAVEDLLDGVTEVQRKIDDLQAQIDATSDPATRQSLAARQLAFRQRVDVLEVDASLRTGGAQLVTPAEAPTDPVEPTPRKAATSAALLGLALGVAVAFLRDHLDDSIKGKDHVERLVSDAPVLGMIPSVEWRDRRTTQVVTLTDPTSSAAEAYRSLRTSVQFLELDQPIRVLQLTSSRAGEGKTTTASNLAVTLAQAGQRVVLVDCDLRRPRLHEFFGVGNEVGFTSVLLGHVSLVDALQRVPDVPRVVVLSSGPLPPNPSELLSGRRTADLIAALQVEADVVVLDSPPVLPVTDAAVLSSRVDGVLVVVGPRTTANQLEATDDTLRRVGAPVIGTILNGFGSDEVYGYGYGYGYADDGPRAFDDGDERRFRRPSLSR